MIGNSLSKKYLDAIVLKRKSLGTYEKSPLILVIDDEIAGQALERIIQKVSRKVSNFEKIFKITTQIICLDSADDRINDMLAELRGASYLIDNNFIDIEYNENGYDFSAEPKYAIEIEYLRGPNFKGQEKYHDVYKLNPKIFTGKVREKFKNGARQLERTPDHYRRVVIVVTDRAEKILFEKELDITLEECSKELNIDAILIDSWGGVVFESHQPT